MKPAASQSFYATNKNIINFILSLVIALVVTFLVKEPEFTQAQNDVLFLLVFSVLLWLTEAVSPFSVGLFIIAFLVYSLGFDVFTDKPQDISVFANTFSSSVIWLLLGGFFLASAMTKTKLDEDLINMTLKICGTNPKWILFGLMTVTMIASMLISNTATTAMVVASLIPLINKLGKESKTGKALLLGIPIAATTGGMGTLIGTPPNAIAVGALNNVGISMEFINWLKFGLPVAILLTFISWWVLVKLFMKVIEPIENESSTAKKGTDSQLKLQRNIVIGVLIVTLIMWLSSPLHGIKAAAVSAIPLVVLTLTGVLKGEDIRKMGWDTLLLVAGGLSLGIGLQETGLLSIYAERIATINVSDTVFLLILAYATMLFSNIMSNTATSTVLIPLGMAILPNMQLEVAMIIGLSASTALFLPVSTPPNAIVYSTGLIEQKDLRLGGTLIGLFGPALIVLWVLLVS
ncbi:DASS family sodium-coupled anion symporter [Flavobacterium sp.]|uniref:SLC13 family permease n=1 Tax=Flavobacterium sp. TaxID=239 RepID=UPI0025C4F3D2|nr:DASS family sodium-coupled anion symporter [Flavobacterium sp.]MBA4153803.1 transporter [Flavobacterium sp.]